VSGSEIETVEKFMDNFSSENKKEEITRKNLVIDGIVMLKYIFLNRE
jgi:hypothetical protein